MVEVMVGCQYFQYFHVDQVDGALLDHLLDLGVAAGSIFVFRDEFPSGIQIKRRSCDQKIRLFCIYAVHFHRQRIIFPIRIHFCFSPFLVIFRSYVLPY